MTVTEQSKFVGRTAAYEPATLPGFIIAVKIVDMRSVFGRTDAKIAPLKGSGFAWVSMDSLRMDK